MWPWLIGAVRRRLAARPRRRRRRGARSARTRFLAPLLRAPRRRRPRPRQRDRRRRAAVHAARLPVPGVVGRRADPRRADWRQPRSPVGWPRERGQPRYTRARMSVFDETPSRRAPGMKLLVLAVLLLAAGAGLYYVSRREPASGASDAVARAGRGRPPVGAGASRRAPREAPAADGPRRPRRAPAEPAPAAVAAGAHRRRPARPQRRARRVGVPRSQVPRQHAARRRRARARLAPPERLGGGLRGPRPGDRDRRRAGGGRRPLQGRRRERVRAGRPQAWRGLVQRPARRRYVGPALRDAPTPATPSRCRSPTSRRSWSTT